MFRYLSLLREPIRVPMLYRRRLGSGRTVSIVVSDRSLELNNLVLRFERKIESSNVVDGKLARISFEEVKKRGGKRSTTLALSYESAEALYVTLGGALKDARKRHIWHQFSNWMMSVVFAPMNLPFPR
jgi:hypothetical protein